MGWHATLNGLPEEVCYGVLPTSLRVWGVAGRSRVMAAASDTHVQLQRDMLPEQWL